jgi:regulatory protein
VYFFIFGAMSSSGSSYSQGRTSPEKALQKLKHFCGYQERSHSDVKQKLYSLGLFKKEVDELISRLIEEDYLNEERFAIQFASGKSRIKGWGKVKIRYELKQKGISEFCIVKALKSLNESEYAVSFKRIADKKWLALQSEKNIFVKKNKWRQFLLQRGFDHEIIKTWSFPKENEAGSAAD